ncbi:MAG: AraC family transcriptional regulator, partial [Clostridiales bacterium]|nr:AraC family transcriptional regulator [Clostridiales bacterium]
MNYNELIRRVLFYIDENLKNELNADILSELAGFSAYHFCRVFQWYAGYSVMEYVRLRRLAFAAWELSS